MEQEFFERLRAMIPPSPHLQLGIGDDAAVLRWGVGGDVVVTTDAITDQIDFRLGEATPEQIGHKALGVNLSDLAAMAAEPVATVVSLVLPRRDALELATGILRGMLPLVARFDVAIAGGDTNVWDGPLAISVTAIGRTTARGPITRSGARPGDVLLATGAFGGSVLGRHLAVEPRIAEALRMHAGYELHAAIDVSDGLSLDSARLAAASGCGVALNLAAIPIAAAARELAETSGRTALEHALSDGEDFELLLAASPAVAEAIFRDRLLEVAVTRIGEFVEQVGLWQITDSGKRTPLEPAGFLHR
jgi:thiamine-monophosphate kinase